MINEYENTLRTIVLEFLGNDVSKYKISNERILKWEEKKEEEIRKNNGICLENRLIYYSDFYDLQTIISNNWAWFKNLFDDKKRFEVMFKEISDYRNTLAHGRTLLKSQLLFIEAILLDLKTLKTVYHNKNEMTEDYFIRIEKITDNLGNIWGESVNRNCPILRVDDNYELIIEAHDPKGREIVYEVADFDGKLLITQKENRFNFKIPASFIGERKTLIIKAKTPSSEYKNSKTICITLTVLPK